MSKKNFKPNNGRSAKKTIIVVCSVLLGVTLCVLGTAALYINHMLDKIDYENTPGQEDGQSVVEIYDDQNLWNDDVLNVLLLGTDERSEEYSDNARSDCMMILSLNRKTHKIRLTSLERGIGVPIEGQEDDWLTHTFAYGGAALTLKTIQECFDLDVDRYVRVNFNAFEQISTRLEAWISN